MEALIQDFIAWLAQVPPGWAYILLLLIAYFENVVPPIPGDLLIVFGGYLVGIGRLEFLPVIVLATLGGALGFMTMYAIGRRIGHAVLDPERLRWLPKEQIEKARDWLQRWGYGVVAANRFLSGARSVISLTVGMAEMEAWKTAAYATFSAAIWTGLITYAGFAVGENWEAVVDFLQRYGQVVLALLVLVVVVQGVRIYRRRRVEAIESEAPPR